MRAAALLTAGLAALSACTTAPPPAARAGKPPAPFDLTCLLPNGATLAFHFGVDDDGDPVVETRNGQPLPGFATHTYVNAYMWTDTKTRYVVDRFSGQLTVRPAEATYACAVDGRSRF